MSQWVFAWGWLCCVSAGCQAGSPVLQPGSAVNELNEEGVSGHLSGPRLASEESAAPGSWWKASSPAHMELIF